MVPSSFESTDERLPQARYVGMMRDLAGGEPGAARGTGSIMGETHQPPRYEYTYMVMVIYIYGDGDMIMVVVLVVMVMVMVMMMIR